jgi:hypothetical protein
MHARHGVDGIAPRQPLLHAALRLLALVAVTKPDR